MTSIFISYRRNDSPVFAWRIFDYMEREYGRENVFLDNDTIPASKRWREIIVEALSRSAVVLAIIGRDWTGAQDDGTRRIDDAGDPDDPDDPGDYVRLEIEFALREGKAVIPILVGDAQMPSSCELPEELKPLASVQALRMAEGADFRHHVRKLIEVIEVSLREAGGGVTSSSRALLPTPGDVEVIRCKACMVSNPRSRKHCLKCAAQLYHVCPDCGDVEVASVDICGECGTSIVAWLRADAHLGTARDHMAAGEFGPAIDELELARRLVPGRTEIRSLLEQVIATRDAAQRDREQALSLEARGQLKRAEAAWRRVLERVPDNEEALEHAASLLALQFARLLEEHTEAISAGRLRDAQFLDGQLKFMAERVGGAADDEAEAAHSRSVQLGELKLSEARDRFEQSLADGDLTTCRRALKKLRSLKEDSARLEAYEGRLKWSTIVTNVEAAVSEGRWGDALDAVEDLVELNALSDDLRQRSVEVCCQACRVAIETEEARAEELLRIVRPRFGEDPRVLACVMALADKRLQDRHARSTRLFVRVGLALGLVLVTAAGWAWWHDDGVVATARAQFEQARWAAVGAHSSSQWLPATRARLKSLETAATWLGRPMPEGTAAAEDYLEGAAKAVSAVESLFGVPPESPLTAAARTHLHESCADALRVWLPGVLWQRPGELGVPAWGGLPAETLTLELDDGSRVTLSFDAATDSWLGPRLGEGASVTALAFGVPCLGDQVELSEELPITLGDVQPDGWEVRADRLEQTSGWLLADVAIENQSKARERWVLGAVQALVTTGEAVQYDTRIEDTLEALRSTLAPTSSSPRLSQLMALLGAASAAPAQPRRDTRPHGELPMEEHGAPSSTAGVGPSGGPPGGEKDLDQGVGQPTSDAVDGGGGVAPPRVAHVGGAPEQSAGSRAEATGEWPPVREDDFDTAATVVDVTHAGDRPASDPRTAGVDRRLPTVLSAVVSLGSPDAGDSIRLPYTEVDGTYIFWANEEQSPTRGQLLEARLTLSRIDEGVRFMACGDERTPSADGALSFEFPALEGCEVEALSSSGESLLRRRLCVRVDDAEPTLDLPPDTLIHANSSKKRVTLALEDLESGLGRVELSEWSEGRREWIPRRQPSLKRDNSEIWSAQVSPLRGEGVSWYQVKVFDRVGNCVTGDFYIRFDWTPPAPDSLKIGTSAVSRAWPHDESRETVWVEHGKSTALLLRSAEPLDQGETSESDGRPFEFQGSDGLDLGASGLESAEDTFEFVLVDKVGNRSTVGLEILPVHAKDDRVIAWGSRPLALAWGGDRVVFVRERPGAEHGLPGALASVGPGSDSPTDFRDLPLSRDPPLSWFLSEDPSREVTLSRDGSTAVVVEADGTVALIETVSGIELVRRDFSGDSSTQCAVAALGGSALITGGAKGMVRWTPASDSADLEEWTGELVSTGESIELVSCSDDAQLVAGFTTEGQVVVHGFVVEHPGTTPMAFAGGRYLCVDPIGSWVLAGDETGRVRAWLDDGTDEDPRLPEGRVVSVAVSPDGLLVALAIEKVGIVILGGDPSGFMPQPVALLGADAATPACLAFDHDGTTLYAADSSNRLRSWTLPR